MFEHDLDQCTCDECQGIEWITNSKPLTKKQSKQISLSMQNIGSNARKSIDSIIVETLSKSK